MPQTGYVFESIVKDLNDRIAAGEYVPGKPIPSIRELSQQYSVAPMTVRRAVAQLCQSSRLKTLPGRGTFVAQGCALDAVVLVSVFQSTDSHPSIGTDIIAGAQTACLKAGIPVITADIHSEPDSYMARSRGYLIHVIGMADPMSVRWSHAVLKARAPYIATGVDFGLTPYIGADNDAASELAIRRLYDLGHRRIALMPRIGASGAPRFRVPTVQLPADAAVKVFPFASNMDPCLLNENVAAAMDLALRQAESPTAFFAGPDSGCLYALDYLRKRGLRVPEDIAVVGYCRSAFGRWRGRQITRVDSPWQELATRATQELIKIGAGGGYAPPARTLVKPQFIEGETAGRL
jgi:DNA-binding LacI/PurR family transcriptional regulator